MGKAKTFQLVEAPSAAAAEEADQLAEAPLFANTGDAKVSHIQVFRVEPDDGYMGKVVPGITEGDLKRKWGGGTYRLQGRDEKNHMIKGGFTTISIAGDPFFESKAARARWERSQGLENETAPAAVAAHEAIGIKEIFALLSSTESKSKSEQDRRLLEQQERHRQDLERIRVESETRARERAEDDARRERAQQERDERQRKEDQDREERRRKDEEAARQRDREFQVMLAQLAKGSKSDSSEMLLKGVELAKKISGGDGDAPMDPVAAIAAALGPTLTGLMEKVKGPAATTTPAAPAAGGGDEVTFEGPLAAKTKAVIAHLVAQGYDPEQAILTVWDNLMKARRATAPAPVAATNNAGDGGGDEPRAPAAPAAAPKIAPMPRSKATTRPKRATTKV